MYRKVVLALMLVMHYSLAFGAIESAAMPDEHHPLGKAVPHSHLHQHSHDHQQDVDVSSEQKHGHGHAPEPDSEHNNPAIHTVHLDSNDDFHDHHHKHGISMQLNVDIPVLVALDFYKPVTPSITPYQLDHDSLSYAPAVPPPDTL